MGWINTTLPRYHIPRSHSAMTAAEATDIAIDKNGRHPIDKNIERDIVEGVIQTDVTLDAEGG